MALLNYPISVFLDTNIFISAKYDFTSDGTLGRLLRYITEGKINLYISDIVQCEISKHIENDFLNLYTNFNKARKESAKKISNNLVKQMSIYYLFDNLNKDNIISEALSVFHKYINDSKVKVLNSSDVDCNQIVSDYFSGNPPFENKSNKKCEFPDAIMIAKLKTIFNYENPVCVISNDMGFRNSFRDIIGFTTFSSLKEIFDLINKESKTYEDITMHILDLDVRKTIINTITKEIYNKGIDMDGLDYDRKGICVGYEYEEVYIDDISELDFDLNSVDDITDDSFSLTLSCQASITAIGSYLDKDNSAWDPEENEYIFSVWGNVEEIHQVEFDCEICYEVKRLDQKEDFKIKSVNFDIFLDEWTRISRCYYEPDNPEEMAKAEAMDALEEYYKH